MDDAEYRRQYYALFQNLQMHLAGNNAEVCIHALTDCIIAALIISYDDEAAARARLQVIHKAMKKSIGDNWQNVKAAGIHQAGGQIGRA